MASVDDRIVQMDFNNRNFESGVATSLSTLDKLKRALTFGKTNGFDDIDKSASKLNLAGVASAVDGISQKFSAMSVIGITALADVTKRAVDAGIRITKSFTIDPIKDGFQQYQQQINATQTILANTSASGATLKTVTATLNTLNDYANKTIYNFSDMATNLGTFTSAGVKLGPASDAIQGLSNVAAAAGAGTQQAAGAMYQLSQALGRGKLQAQDWNSVVAAGMASSNFKTAILETAKAMGVIKMPKTESIDQWIKAGGSFQDAMSKGQITSGVLIQTLQAMTGNMTDAQLAAKGYSAAQIKSIQAMAAQAKAAAVNVKTVTALVDNLKQGVGSAWAAVFKTIFGDLPTVTKTMTSLSVVLSHMFVDPINNLNTLLQAWVKLGGLDKVMQGLVNVFKGLSSVIKPIKDAFHEIFPPETAKELLRFATIFQNLTAMMTIGSTTANNIKRTFAGLFAVLDIGKQIVKGVLTVIGDILGTFLSGTGGVLNFTAGIGDMLVAFDKSITAGGKLQMWFQHLGKELIVPVRFLGEVRDAIYGIFNGWKQSAADGITNGFDRMQVALQPVGDLFQKAKQYLGGFGDELRKVGAIFKPALDAINAEFSQLGASIGQAISSGNFGGVLKVINTGLLGGILLLVKKFFANGLKVDVGGGFLEKIGGTFDALTSKMKAMTLQLKAKALLEIGAALALIVASVAVLATIDAKKMNQALQGLAIGFGELLSGMAILTKVTGAAGVVKLPAMAASLILVSTAILTLTAAVKLMATMSWDEIKKGLTGIGLLLGALSATALILSKSSANMVSAGIGITAISVAMNILFVAVKLFSTLSWKDMIKGLTGVIGSLVGIAGAMRLMPKGMLLQSAAILVIATALQALYLAVKEFSGFDWKQMGKGLAGVAGSLGAIAAAMQVMPKGMVLQAGAIVIISGALLILGKALEQIGNLSWKVIGKGLTGIAGALGVLALALNVMEGTLPGAAAVYVVSKALGILIPILQTLATMKWGDIGKGIGALAAALGVLVLAGAGAELAAGGLLALGAATLGIGAGLALAGIGLKAIADGLALLAKAGPAGVAVLITAVKGLVAQIPALATAFAQGLVDILIIIGKNGPAIVLALQTILDSLLTAIIAEAPKAAIALEAVIAAILKVVVDKAPDIIAAGLTLLEDLLQGISDNIGKVVTQVATIIVNFLDALASHIGEIVAAGANLIVKFLEGIAAHLGQVIAAAGDVIASFVTGLGNQFGKLATAAGGAIASFLGGISNALTQITNAGANLIISFIYGMAKKAIDIVDAAGDAILSFLTGLDAAINKYEPQIISEALKIGADIIKGIVKGVANGVGSIVSGIKGAVTGALGKAGGFVKGLFGSPGKLIGRPLMTGAAEGVYANRNMLTESLKGSINEALLNASKTISKQNNLLDGVIDSSPRITPVLDLTNVQKDATKFHSLLDITPIHTDTSFGHAVTISAAHQQAAQEAVATPDAEARLIPELKFEQNNFSPKALSTIDIYRQTKNQFSQAKAALGIPINIT